MSVSGVVRRWGVAVTTVPSLSVIGNATIGGTLGVTGVSSSATAFNISTAALGILNVQNTEILSRQSTGGSIIEVLKAAYWTQLDVYAGGNKQLEITDGVSTFNVDTLGVTDPTDSLGGLWREVHVDAQSVSPGASGATLTVGGGTNNATLYWLLNAVNEYLYFGTDIEEDWDAGSDLSVKVVVALDGAETANDLIHATLDVEYVGEHENMDSPKEQSISIDHNIGAFNAAGDVHELNFLIDHDLASNVVQDDDIIKFRFYLDDVTTTTPVAAVRFLYAHVRYRANSAHMFTSSPASG